jgi:hypothetical protein
MGLAALAAVIAAAPAGADGQEVNGQRSYYLECITKEIENSTCKVALLTSRSGNLREHGAEAARKAVFFSQNRDALAEEMLRRDVSMRPHAVHQYLLRRFGEANYPQMADNRP